MQCITDPSILQQKQVYMKKYFHCEQEYILLHTTQIT